MWGKTGCLITANGSEDEKIQPEDFKEYNVQTPMPMEPGQVLPVSITAQKTKFLLGISSVNVTKSAGNYGFGQVY